MNKELTHIAGTFLIEASGSAPNGGGLGSGEYDNYTIVKTFKDGMADRGYYTVPFVSAASWRRWLRDTLIEETNWKISKIRALHKNPKGNTDKIGTERNPIEYVEDDLFGYMYPISKEDSAAKNKKIEAEGEEGEEEGEETKEIQEGMNIRGLFRTSPFSSSILVGLRKDGWEGKDQNYVGLVEGSSQPYKTQFMNTALQGIFCLNYNRLGVFSNVGDRAELDQAMIKKYLDNKLLVERPEKPEFYSLEKIAETEVKETKKSSKKPKEQFDPIKRTGKVFELADSEIIRKDRASALLKSLAVLRGGAKQAAFGTDVSPKVLIMAGLTCGNPIFNSLFEDKSISTEQRGKNVALNIEAMKEIVTDYSDRIRTPVFLGIRTGYMQNENKIKEMNNTLVNGIKFVVTTPIDAARQMSECLSGQSGTTTTQHYEMTESHVDTRSEISGVG